MTIIGIDPGKNWGIAVLEGDARIGSLMRGKMKLVLHESRGPHELFKDLINALEPRIWSELDLCCIEGTWKGQMSHEDLAVLNRKIGICISWALRMNPECEIMIVPVGRLSTRGKKRQRKEVKGWKSECILSGRSLMGATDRQIKQYVKTTEGVEPQTIHEACSICIARYGEKRMIDRGLLGLAEKIRRS